jgi:hypothetical protein
MPIGERYTTQEWREITKSLSFTAVDNEQLSRLHRHWIWANHAKSTFDSALTTEGWPDASVWTGRAPWAMFMWYALLSAVIAGLTSRRVRYRGALAKDVHTIREPLRNARNATFHVEHHVACYEERFTRIAEQDATQIRRIHQALGQLLLDEMRRRRDQAQRESS